MNFNGEAGSDGSYIERKESVLVWHYKNAGEFGQEQAKHMLENLEKVLANVPVVVKLAQDIVEIKPKALVGWYLELWVYVSDIALQIVNDRPELADNATLLRILANKPWALNRVKENLATRFIKSSFVWFCYNIYNSSKKRKEYIVLTCGHPFVNTVIPSAKGEDENSCSDDDDESSNETVRTYVAHYEHVINKLQKNPSWKLFAENFRDCDLKA
ncbi:Glycosyl transferase, family 20 [Artemisia annua]|uniref:Glycosyl transferase, family 20 n=1 Tax=Artemisia annua TaxID=35608 RepID=A0A2U1KF21_ARTAN|nr:Glycosyl transferase, family 20 [Artemisia annua]